MAFTSRADQLVAALEVRPLAHSREWICARWGARTLDRALASGRVTRILDGQYAATIHASSFPVRVSATSAWLGERGVVGGCAAAHVWGLVSQPPRTIAVFARPRIHVRGPGWMRIRHREPQQHRVNVNGLGVAAINDAVIQSWEELGVARGPRTAIEAVRRSLTTASGIAERSIEYPTLKHRGQLMALLDDLVGGIDSFLELHAHRNVFTGPMFPVLARHARIETRHRAYEADFYHPASRLDIETDGSAFHNDDLARRRDLERDAHLAGVGVQTLRFTYEDIMERPKWCREQTLAAIAARTHRKYG